MQGIFQGAITTMQQFAVPIALFGLIMLGLTYMAALANPDLIRDHRRGITFFVAGMIIVTLSPYVVPVLFSGIGGVGGAG